jgi:flagellar hook protein FlgE
MGLSTALYNGVSGLSTLSESLNVIGDNLANVNTTGFKSSNALFETVFSQTLTGATGPSENTLGTNPIQVGLGVKLSTIVRDFTQGSLNSTGKSGDLAIQDNGFFILSDGIGQAYTRDGSFGLAVDGTLVDPATGLRVQGYQAVNGVITSTGSVGDIVIPIGMSIAQATSNALFSGNFDAASAIGDSYTLSGLHVFDSLGNAVPLDITFTKTGTNDVTYVAESPTGTIVGTGIITYDTNGQFVGVTNDLISIDRSAQGAVSPLDVTLDFTGTTFLSGENSLALGSQNGYPIGSLEEYFVGVDGVITGFFSNGQTLILGQVALATFPNQQGLLTIGNNLYVTSANSGEPNIGEAGTGGKGTIVGGFLEGSNVDLSRELTNIIIAQTGFQANTRTITTADKLLQEVLTLVR